MSRGLTLATRRLHGQHIAAPSLPVADLVAWMGAMQAQDYLGCLWAVGLRVPGAKEASVEKAIADGDVVRIHALRCTWQLIFRDDVRWMLGLVADKVRASMKGRLRELGLEAATVARASRLLARATGGGQALTRAEAAGVLRDAKIDPGGQRLSHLLLHAELDGAITSGGRRGKQTTFANFDERIPAARPVSRADALAELAVRYARSRGPVQVRDFVWWAGLGVADARAGLENAGLERETAGAQTYFHAAPPPRPAPGRAHLLPPFDEYLVGYQDRSAVLDPAHTKRVNAGGGILPPCIVVDGQVVGTWRRTFEKSHVVLAMGPLRPLGAKEQTALRAAGERYGAYLEKPVRWEKDLP